MRATTLVSFALLTLLVFGAVIPVRDVASASITGVSWTTSGGESIGGGASVMQSVSAAWSGSLGPEGGQVNALAVSPGYATDHTLFAGTSGGMYISYDGGTSWEARNSGINTIYVPTPILSVATSPAFATDHTVFAGTVAGVFRSSDGGTSWSAANTGLSTLYIRAVAISAGYATDHTLFAATDSGLFRSVSGGTSWQSVNPRPNNTGALSVALSPGYATDHTLFAGSEAYGGLSRSTDGGNSWQTVASPLNATNVDHVVMSPGYASDHTLFASTGGGVLTSSNGGDSWTSVSTGFTSANIYVLSLAVSPGYTSDGTLFAGTNIGPLRSSNSGAAWQTVTTGITVTNVNSVALSPTYATDHALFAGTDGAGVFRSTDSGNSWQAANGMLVLTAVQSLALSPAYATDHTIFAGTKGGGVFRSTDGGVSWQAVNGGLTNAYVTALVLSPAYATDHTLFAGTNGGGVFRTTDGGGSWVEANGGISGIQVVSLAISPGYATDHTLFVGQNYWGLWRSTDSGNTWQQVLWYNSNTTPAAVVLSPGYATDRTIFASTGAVIRSIDGGSTWQAAGSGLASPLISSLALSPAYPTDHTLFAGTGGWDGVYRSVDGGNTWQAAGSGLTSVNVSSLAVSPAYATTHTLFSGTAGGVFRSGDGGTSWLALGGLPNTDVRAVALSPAYATDVTLFAGIFGSGVFKMVTTAPGADFTASPTTGPAPLSVQFTDTSTNGPTSWSWDFQNDGTADSTLQNPSYNYTVAGQYSIKLTATNDAGSNSVTKINLVTVQGPPVANFTAVPTSGNAPLTVQFTDTSTSTPTSWAWDFQNDGTNDSAVQNPSFTYTAAGQYNVKLVATNAAGSANITKLNFISVAAAPVANFTAAPTSGNSPLTVQFTDTSTNTPTSWAWDFQNNGTNDSTVQSPMFSYTATGQYSVRLTATNAAGSNSVTKNNLINVAVQASDTPILLETTSTAVTLGQQFDVTVSVNLASGQQTDGAELYANFDKTKLQVVDTDTGNSITTGTNMLEDKTKLDTVLSNSCDNSAGQCTYSAGKLTGLPQGPQKFKIATITFRAVAEASQTGISLSFSGARVSKVDSGGNTVSGQHQDLSMQIVYETPVKLAATHQGGGAISPSSPVVENETFNVDVSVEVAAGQDLVGAEVYLNYDNTKLDAMDADTGNTVTTGINMLEDKTKLDTVLANACDNTAGQCTYSAGKLTQPFPPGAQNVHLATAKFRVKSGLNIMPGGTIGSPISVSLSAPRQTSVVNSSNTTLLGTHQDATITIQGGINVSGTVVFQGGSRPKPAGWQKPLTVMLFTSGVDVMNTSPTASYNVVTDFDATNNLATFTLSGVTPGTYDVAAVSPGSLVGAKRNVTFSATQSALSMGTLVTGNAVNWNNYVKSRPAGSRSDKVDISDFGKLAICYLKQVTPPTMPAVGTLMTDADLDSRLPALPTSSADANSTNCWWSDFDGSGAVNISDFGLLATNFLKLAPIE